MPLEAAAGDTIIVIDDHESVRHSLRAFLETEGLLVKDYATAETFLADGMPPPGSCLIVDINMPGMSGLELQEELVRRNLRLPLIVVTGHGDVSLAVRAMKAGAADFLEKPFDDIIMLAAIRRAIREGRHSPANPDEIRDAIALFGLLTEREREVMGRLTLGESNKQVAHQLGISPRTVEIHRAHLQEKLKTQSGRVGAPGASGGATDMIRTSPVGIFVCPGGSGPYNMHRPSRFDAGNSNQIGRP